MRSSSRFGCGVKDALHQQRRSILTALIKKCTFRQLDDNLNQKEYHDAGVRLRAQLVRLRSPW